MPEIKHQFTGGKMNKDLDERLIPNGEYRDAMNVQVLTSEGSDVGTVQNILGNIEISSCTLSELEEHCVASIADEKNDVGYYFIASNNTLQTQG
jgi:rRNA processing protein Gar1